MITQFTKHFRTVKRHIGLSICISLSILSYGQTQKPNIIFIMADDLGFECISSNGGTSYQTPNIDQLASDGMRFENCHALSLCTPSRVQVMTGQYNVRNYTEFGILSRSQKSFGNLLKDAGYSTAIAGKWQLGKESDSPQHFGFEQSCLWQQSLGRTDAEGHDTRFSNPVLEFNGEVQNFTNGEFGPDVVINFICDFIEENNDQPFFAYYPMLLTHCPFIATPNSDDWDPTDKGALNYKGEPKYFTDMVSYVDMIVGRIVSTVDRLGLAENTIIIFTGDNGTDQPIVSILNGKSYPGGKTYTTDNGTHVPLLVRWSNHIQAGRECPDLIDFSDILPTICDASNTKIPSEIPIDGRSFLPQLLGENATPRAWIYNWYSPYLKSEDLKEFTRDKIYKLYRTGEFFNVKDDFYEENSLVIDQLNEEEIKHYRKLKEGLDLYKDI